MKWRNFNFEEAIYDVTSGNRKIQSSSYLAKGAVPIVDQGKNLITGYTNDESATLKFDKPVIVFGDHTRIFKYIDFPFVLGADGVKVLRGRDDLDTKFLYYFFQTIQIPETGYNRHFKFLKEISIPIPSLRTQRRIVFILDKVDDLREKNLGLIKLYDDLIQSIFYESFGDPVNNEKMWHKVKMDEVCDIQGGLQISKTRNSLPVKVPYLRVANVYRNELSLSEVSSFTATKSEINRTLLKKDDLLIVEGHGNKSEIGRAALWDGSIPFIVHQNHIIRARPNRSIINPVYLSSYWNSSGGRRQLFASSNTTSGLNTISTRVVKEVTLILPPIKFQQKYAECIVRIGKQRALSEESLFKTESLFQSLLQKAFNGKLV